MVDEWHNRMKQKWNDSDRGNPKCSERNLFQNQSAQNKSHVSWLVIVIGPQIGAYPSLSTVISPL
jgi:hypothetical protein